LGEAACQRARALDTYLLAQDGAYCYLEAFKRTGHPQARIATSDVTKVVCDLLWLGHQIEEPFDGGQYMRESGSQRGREFDAQHRLFLRGFDRYPTAVLTERRCAPVTV